MGSTLNGSQIQVSKFFPVRVKNNLRGLPPLKVYSFHLNKSTEPLIINQSFFSVYKTLIVHFRYDKHLLDMLTFNKILFLLNILSVKM